MVLEWFVEWDVWGEQDLSCDGVEDEQEFSHDGDEGDFGRFACGEQTLVEGAQLGMMTCRDQGGHPEAAAQSVTSAADVAWGAGLPAVAVVRGHADQGGQRTAADPSEFGQFGQQHRRGLRTNARLLLQARGQRGVFALHLAGDLRVELGELPGGLGERCLQLLFDQLLGGVLEGLRSSVWRSTICQRPATSARSRWAAAAGAACGAGCLTSPNWRSTRASRGSFLARPASPRPK